MTKALYFVKDLNDAKRPLMGDLGIYCVDDEAKAQWGMDADSAKWLCDLLNDKGVEYENSEYAVVKLDVVCGD